MVEEKLDVAIDVVKVIYIHLEQLHGTWSSHASNHGSQDELCRAVVGSRRYYFSILWLMRN